MLFINYKSYTHGEKFWTRTRSKYTDLGEFETIWLYKTTSRGGTVGGVCGGGVTPPQRLKNGVVVGQFANLLGNILHGQFSPTFAILREKYI